MKKSRTSLHNLPSPLSSFIGREREIAQVKQLLLDYRLVTLTGPGGAGKTRLALKVAHELIGQFENGVWLIELASLSNSSLLPQAVASVLDVPEKPGYTLTDLLADHFRSFKALLVLDNCEHLIIACAQLTETLLQKCPDLKILCTSREAMGISGEIVWAIPPLALPEKQPWTSPAGAQNALTVYARSEAVRLFVDRAMATAQDFDLNTENGGWISEICRRLDGMPLAIELAAARVRTLSVQQIAQRLDDRFRLLTGGSRAAEPRQQTLAATLGWSYALLSDSERNVLQRLSVFAGGCTLEAVEAVCTGDDVNVREALDILTRLVEKSLIVVEKNANGEARYHLLETIRQYAVEKLAESGNEEKIRVLHLNYFMELAEQGEPHLQSWNQVEWLDRFETEHDNFRAALGWSRRQSDRVELGMRLAASLSYFWEARGHFNEGREQLTELLDGTGKANRTLARAKALYRLAILAFNQTDYPETRLRCEESLATYRDFGLEGQPGVAYCLITLGDMWRELGDYATADAQLNKALDLMRSLNNLRGIYKALWQLGYSAASYGDYARAERYFEEALPLSKQDGDALFTAIILTGWAETAIRQKDFGRAAKLEEESLALRRKVGEKWGIAVSLANFAWISLCQHDLGQALTLLLESLAIRREIGDPGGVAWCLEKLAKINILRGKELSKPSSRRYFQRAVRLFSAAAKLRAPFGSVIDKADMPEYDRDVGFLKEQLGKDSFTASWVEGESLSLNDIDVNVSLADEDANQAPAKNREEYGGLTAREREVAALIAQGKSNREIANALTVGVKTIETYVTRILNKLGFDSRVQIAMWAKDRGLA